VSVTRIILFRFVLQLIGNLTVADVGDSPRARGTVARTRRWLVMDEAEDVDVAVIGMGPGGGPLRASLPQPDCR
jgi:hypothetical protein